MNSSVVDGKSEFEGLDSQGCMSLKTRRTASWLESRGMLAIRWKTVVLSIQVASLNWNMDIFSRKTDIWWLHLVLSCHTYLSQDRIKVLLNCWGRLFAYYYRPSQIWRTVPPWAHRAPLCPAVAVRHRFLVPVRPPSRYGEAGTVHMSCLMLLSKDWQPKVWT